MSKTTEMVVKMNLNYGRMGSLEGVFIVDKDEFDLAVKLNPQVYFGEVLGKHSEVYCDFNDISFEVKAKDPEKIALLVEMGVLGSGHNPFEYLGEHNPEWREGNERRI